MEESEFDSGDGDSRFSLEDQLDDGKAKNQTPLIDTILGDMKSVVDRVPANYSERILREIRMQYGDVPVDDEICTTIVSRLLHNRLGNRVASKELLSVAKPVAVTMMGHAPTRSRIDKLWQTLRETQE